MTLRVRSVAYTDRFQRDVKALDAAMQAAVQDAIERLLQYPIPRSLRHHVLGATKPKIHKIDVTSNHSHQVTFMCDGDEATLLRVATHKEIDRSPR